MCKRFEIIKAIGEDYLTKNIETDEYSYVRAAGSKQKLEKAVGHVVKHFKADLRFCSGDKDNVVVIVETKQRFSKKDEKQLAAYIKNEKALNPKANIIGILADTNDDHILVWHDEIKDDSLLKEEDVLDTMEHYKYLCAKDKIKNDKEKVIKNTYTLNEILHKKGINESIRCQFAGTVLLYIIDESERKKIKKVDKNNVEAMKSYWMTLTEKQIIAGIEDTIESKLNETIDAEKRIRLLKTDILEHVNVKNLPKDAWIEILTYIFENIYAYIDLNSPEGQDLLNLFFVTFTKYVGKKDKNQAFTPDHIANFMCKATGLSYRSKVMDFTCGSGSFLVNAMVKALSDCKTGHTEKETDELMKKVKENILGIEVDPKAYALTVTNMLIHGNYNCKIKNDSAFNCKQFIIDNEPDVILLNPPYNASPITIPNEYKVDWDKSSNGKTDPTKGLVFVRFISDIYAEINKKNGKTATMAVILPVSAAIGTSDIIRREKDRILKNSTLNAVITLPDDVFYPGAAVQTCCMLFTLGEPHVKADKSVRETLFIFGKEDGFKKKKNIGRIEQFDEQGVSKWKQIEDKWLNMYRNKTVIEGLSASHVVTAEDEWLCEAYMEVNYNLLNQNMFKNTVSKFLAHLMEVSETEQAIKIIETCKNSEKKVKIEQDVSSWKEFKVKDLFKKVSVKHYPAIPEDEGNIPFISSTSLNNGISGYVEADAIDGNCITVSTNGDCFDCFYQEKDFAISTDVEALYNDKLNTYNALFIVTILKMQKLKYGYGRKPKNGKLYETVIKLPACNDEPDWKYMEDYIKNNSL